VASDYYVYCWTNTTNGKQYIGKGRGRRAREHLSHFKTRNTHLVFYRALTKYGPDAFSLCFLALGLEEELAFELETVAISVYGTQKNGYNCTAGGEGLRGLVRTEEHARHISEAKRGKAMSPEACANIKAAKQNVSVETRQKMAEAKRGKSQPDSQKQARSKALTGKPWSEARWEAHRRAKEQRG
jgi:group I intron endonuclease